MPLRRLTNDFAVKTLPSVLPNEFWQQVSDVIGPALQEQAFRHDYYVPVKAGDDFHLHELLATDLASGLPQCVMLIGQYGVGKTSLLRRLEEHLREPRGSAGWQFVYFDGNRHISELTGGPKDRKTLVRLLADCVASHVDKAIRQGKVDRDALFQNIYDEDDFFGQARLERRLLSPERVAAALGESDALRLRSYLSGLARVYPGRVIVAVDNIDPFPADTQIAAIALIHQHVHSTAVHGLVPVRRSTDAQLSLADSAVIGPMRRHEVEPPDILQVVKRRLDVAFSSPKCLSATIGVGTLRSRIADSPEFVQTMIDALSAPTSRRFLEEHSNGSTRDALHFARRVYNSHYLDASRLIRKLSPVEELVPSYWSGRLPYYVVVKSVLLCNRHYYDPDRSRIGNVYGTQLSNTIAGPLLRLLTLKYFRKRDGVPQPADTAITSIAGALSLAPADIARGIQECVDRGWLDGATTALSLSRRGRFMIQLASDAEYLTHIAVDVDVPDRVFGDISVPASDIRQRLKNLVAIVSHIADAELRLLTELLNRTGISAYVDTFGHDSIGDAIRNDVVKTIKQLRPTRLGEEGAGVADAALFSVTLQPLGELEGLEAPFQSKTILESYG